MVILRRFWVGIGTRTWLATALVAMAATTAHAQAVRTPNALSLGRQPIEFKVSQANDRLEMVVNSSRILTLDQKIPKAQVNNPDVIKLYPLSATQIQISALKAGVTQVNLWDEKGEVHAIDVLIYGDAQELQMLLETTFPTARLKVLPLSNSAVISGHVDRPELVNKIVQFAEDYYPKVISTITVGGVHQVLLHVKVMEVSRTKLRTVGIDFAHLGATGGFAGSGITQLIQNVGQLSTATNVVSSGNETFAFGLVSGNDRFFALMEALRENNLMKILAEPDIVTLSGRPASFNVGGEFPVLAPAGLGTVSIEYKKFGTSVDFVPIVMGDGLIRLEVRPRVSERDNSNSVTLDGFQIPSLTVREVDTGVEMRAGQTLAIAGLVQTRVEAVNRGLPWFSDLPYIGSAFRRVRELNNEVELLILVTPELVDALDPHEVPVGGPGTSTVSPDDCELYFKGYLEVPRCHPPYTHGGRVIHEQNLDANGVETIPDPNVEDPVDPPTLPVPSAGRMLPKQHVRRVGPNPYGLTNRPTQLPTSQSFAGPGRVAPPVAQQRTDRYAAPAGVRRLPATQNRIHHAHRYQPTRRQEANPPTAATSQPGLIGPIGYDIKK